MRQKIAVGILILFCFFEIRPLEPIWDYYLNYDYISEVLCINKDEPLASCKGKCYLSQQLKEILETEKQDKSSLKTEQEKIQIAADNTELRMVPSLILVSQHPIFQTLSIDYLAIPPPTPPPKSSLNIS